MAHVLIVDDEKSMRVTLSAFLRDAGYEVQTREDAEEAQALLTTEPFDVVVSDIILPRVTGVELLKTIRQAAPSVQVIMMTGEPTVDTATEALRVGACDYLFKPISKDQLLKAVANAAKIKALGDERTRLEEANRQYQENLEGLVEKQTRKLRKANRQLRKALAEVKETQSQLIQQERLRALGEMASGVAHDFNNDLAVIQGYTELLLLDLDCARPPGKEKQKGMLQNVLAAAKDGAETVRRLRGFYRAPDDEDEFFPVDLNELVDQAESLTRPKWEGQASARGVSVNWIKDLPPIPAISGNSSQLREVLTNLIFNAVDAISAPGGTLSIRTGLEGEQVVLEVADSGAGMPEDVRQRCLEPFFTTKGEGSGLGLSVVYGIVERHGGALEVLSTPGAGTRFVLRFPVSSQERQSPRGSRKRESPVRSLRILVVEDEEIIRRMLVEYLSVAGHVVHTAPDGAKGLVECRGGKFDLVVTDQAMPGITGDELAAAIKSADPEMPVVLLTGFADFMKGEAKPASVDLVLKKPTSLPQLQRAIATVLRKRA